MARITNFRPLRGQLAPEPDREYSAELRDCVYPACGEVTLMLRTEDDYTIELTIDADELIQIKHAMSLSDNALDPSDIHDPE